MTWRIALALVGGCNWAFGIPTSDHASDATVIVDVALAVDAGPCGTHDEDIDGMPDLCDLCPMVHDAIAESDTDGDGVGDACDPAPMKLGDRLAMFDGFDTQAAGWEAVGTWTFNNDQVGYTDAALGTLHRLLPQPSRVATAETEVTFTTADTTSAAGLDLVLAVHTFRCVVYRDVTDLIQLYDATAGTMLQSQTLGGAGAVLLRVGHRATGEITCSGARLGAAAVDASDTGKFVENVVAAGFASGGIPIKSPYLAVYTSP